MNLLRVQVRLLYIFKVFLVFAAYFITARIGLQLGAVSGFATLVWPPTGIALATLLVFGYRLWPGIALAAFLVNFITGAPLLAAIAIGNTLEAVVGTFLLRLFGFKNTLERVEDALYFIVFGVLVNSMISATIAYQACSQLGSSVQRPLSTPGLPGGWAML